MDHQLLVDKILARVMDRMSIIKEQEGTTNKNKVLIVSEIHKTICHQMLENEKFILNCIMDCAYLKEYCCNVEEYDTVVIFDFSNQNLVKIASGIGDSPFTQMAIKAILLGKKVIVPKHEVELFQYEKTAPKAYYGMMKEKLNLLESAGVVFIDQCELEKILVGVAQGKEDLVKDRPSSYQEMTSQKEVLCTDGSTIKRVTIDKKVITESDIRKLVMEGTKEILIPSKALITDVAKEYLQNRRIEIQRQAAMDRR